MQPSKLGPLYLLASTVSQIHKFWICGLMVHLYTVLKKKYFTLTLLKPYAGVCNWGGGLGRFKALSTSGL